MHRQLRKLAPIAVLLAGLVLVAFATTGLARLAQEADRERFLSLVDDRQNRITRQIERHFALLNGALAFFHSIPQSVEQAAFRRYVEGLEIDRRFDGIQGLGYAMRVAAEDLPSVERLLNDLYGPNVNVWPPPVQREAHPIVYLRPNVEENLVRLGFDLASDPVRRRALERARDTGEPSATAPIEIMGRPGQRRELGFMLVLAHFGTAGTPTSLNARRQDLRGLVFARFNAADFFSGALYPSTRSPVHLKVYDEATGPARALFDSSIGQVADEWLTERRVMTVAGRQWIVEFAAGEAFRSSLPIALLAAFAAVGMLFSGAAAGVVHFQVQALDVTLAPLVSIAWTRTGSTIEHCPSDTTGVDAKMTPARRSFATHPPGRVTRPGSAAP